MRKNIKRLLLEKGWTQTDLAEHLGFSPQHISQIISGKVNGTQKFWDKFKAVLNIPDDEIEKYRKKE